MDTVSLNASDSACVVTVGAGLGHTPWGWRLEGPNHQCTQDNLLIPGRLSHLGTSLVIRAAPSRKDLRTLIQALLGVNRRVASAMVSTWLPRGPDKAGAQRTTHTLTESHPLHVSSRYADRHALSFQASVAVSQLPTPDMARGWLPKQRHRRSAPVLYLLSNAGQLSLWLVCPVSTTSFLKGPGSEVSCCPSAQSLCPQGFPTLVNHSTCQPAQCRALDAAHEAPAMRSSASRCQDSEPTLRILFPKTHNYNQGTLIRSVYEC